MQNYRQRLVEVNEVLNNLSLSDYSKIPIDVIKNIQNNMDKEYTWQYDKSKTLNEQDIHRDTIIILSFINIEYLLNDDQKKYMKKMFDLNDQIRQNELVKKYNVDDLFKEEKRVKMDETQPVNNVQLIEYKESILKRILNSILSVFKR